MKSKDIDNFCEGIRVFKNYVNDFIIYSKSKHFVQEVDFENITEQDIELLSLLGWSRKTEFLYEFSPDRLSIKGNVYVFGSSEKGLYKIGRTTKLNKRFSTIKASCPFKIKIIDHALVEDSQIVEKLIYDEFKEYKTNGEWFNFNHSQLARITEILIGYEA